MRKSILVTTAVLGLSVVLSGCAYQVTELEEDEQEEVAAYCAKVVAKHNENNGKGLVKLAVSEDDEESEDDTSSEASEDTSSSSESATSEDDSATENETVSLSRAIGIKGIRFSFRDAKTSGSYESNDVYDLSPDAGNELLVIRVRAKNTGKKDIKLDMTTKDLKFTASYGDQSANADMTLLMNDLTTFQGTIKAGKSRDLVVLFQFPKGTVKDTSKLSYTVTDKKTVYQIDTSK